MRWLKLQAGAELVEFALLLPLLLILVFGIADFSLMLFDKVVITNASREGARAGVVYNVGLDGSGKPMNARLTDDEIRQVVRDYCESYLVTFETPPVLTIVPTPQTAARSSGETLTVRVDYTYDYVVISKLIPSLNSLSLSATSVMRFE